MSVILAIDTSTQACSCAVNHNGNIEEAFDIIPRQHARLLLPMIDELFGKLSVSFSDLDAVAYGQGPGSFTGLRIAAGVTQGIALGAGIPVVPVSSLASMAYQIGEDSTAGVVFATLDARIDEVYWGFYAVESGKVELLGEEGLCKPELLPVKIPGNALTLVGAGSGLEYLDRMPEIYRETLSSTKPGIYPRAGAIAGLAAGYLDRGLVQAPEDVNPVYLRDKVTNT